MTAAPDATIEQQLRELNDALLVSSVRQHEMAEQAQAADAVVRESEERYRTLFDLVPVAVYSCDAAGVIQKFNRRAAELWDRDPAPGDTDERFCGSYKMFRPDGSHAPRSVSNGRGLERQNIGVARCGSTYRATRWLANYRAREYPSAQEPARRTHGSHQLLYRHQRAQAN